MIFIILALASCAAPLAEDNTPTTKTASVKDAARYGDVCIADHLFRCKYAESLTCEVKPQPCTPAPDVPIFEGCICYGKCQECFWPPYNNRFFLEGGHTCKEAMAVAKSEICADCGGVYAESCYTVG